MSFKSAVKTSNNKEISRTSNGMKAYATTGTSVLDFFSGVGAARGRDMSAMFMAALAENEDLAIRALLWTRDIRGGAGERQQFRNILSKLEAAKPALAGRIMPLIPELGRWDDLFTYTEYTNRQAAFAMIKEALDAKNGLAAKWMPRKGPIAVELTKYLGLTPKAYRRLVVDLTKVVETQMCAKDWDNINFSQVPSVASARYQKAFGRNATEAYAKYLRELQKPQAERDPKVKINAGAVYPYDILKSVFAGSAAVADEQWKALPNFIGDAKLLPMIDVSGSMGSPAYSYGVMRPIHYALSLGLYCAEKNTGDFNGLYLTFSEKPVLKSTKGGTLKAIWNNMLSDDWGMNTNLHKAFDEILRVAVKGDVTQEDMPEYLVIFSDMQFDRCARFDDSAKEMIARKYEAAGFEMPKIIFWNLNGTDNKPVSFNDQGVCNVSGFSPSLMKTVLGIEGLEDFTPYNVMVKTLMDERYNY